AGVLGLGAEVLFDLAVRLAIALLVLGILDYLIQRWKLERRLRMTKQEVRDELKKMEGDPLVKQRRRQIQARLALQRIRAEVPRADVVVTNPTHFAVALRYDEATMSAPRVTAKGRDLLAERIRQLAQQHGVPIVQRPPLARALYTGVEVGQEVPPAFYRAVAEVLAYVYQLSGRVAG
ncbi:MAG TPA: EscU/YscU/HrcU family type III secretion system export apparatus switch protein, partial [Phycisphaerae bacterium]|nr:EscU/YscU/HrcU family type III secretion system export apparatus switch protein [Phycisphaerae bacterium]